MKKRKVAIALILAAVLAGGGVFYYRMRSGGKVGKNEQVVFVDSVGNITGVTANNGLIPRFAGVVEAQKTQGIEADSGMKVKDTFVSVGQEVTAGTRLFSYDTDEAQDSITQLEIDIENNEISIESSKAQKQTLENEKSKASEKEQLSYTTQIMTIENSIKRYEYENKSKQAEMESLQKKITNSVVTSPIDGIVKSIKSSTGNDTDTSDNSNAYITIMQTGEYRVKGMINEQNVQQIYEGMTAVIRSRVDENLTWTGTVASIDRENATSSSSSDYGSSDSSMSSSSSYPFYVQLESSDGLMLGQHVYIEENQGQGEVKEGMWLDDYYFITDDSGEVTPYVWAAGSNDRLEKRQLTLGEYDQDNFKYQVLDGLTAEDYIAYPEEDYTEGIAVTRNIDQVVYSGDDSDYSEYEYSSDDFGDDYSDEDSYSDNVIIDDSSDDEFETYSYDDDDSSDYVIEDNDANEAAAAAEAAAAEAAVADIQVIGGADEDAE
ncbi:MAG: efflux RND transporter periplasmic adaptor subunit [Eubacteriales bacterium]|nr:efflux RND transporter periplasmic adaptor subunit [Eubacteriales bacterium]